MTVSKAWYVVCFAMLGSAGCMVPADDASTAEVSAPVSSDALGPRGCTWTQWGQSASHDGTSCVVGEEPRTAIQSVVHDPFAAMEIADGRGVLLVHYQAPLSDADGNVYMVRKGGTYKQCEDPAQQVDCGQTRQNVLRMTWSEVKYQRRPDGSFDEAWSFETDWKPAPFGDQPLFQPALAGPFMYVPGAGGSVWQILTIGQRAIALQRINPFDTLDPNTYVTSGITVDALGFVYWNVIQPVDATSGNNRGFLVKAAPWGQTWKVDYETLTPGAPAATDLCFTTFSRAVPRPPRPWPPSADALPPQLPCGRQRAGFNVTPAIGRDGTIFTASAASLNNTYSYIIAVKPDLSLKWATSLRGIVNDGCGVSHPDAPEGDHVSCSSTFSAIGVDPNTNLPPALEVNDGSSSSPVALPDGGVLYGALDFISFGRGHLVKLDRNGRLAGTYQFGWDSTPAVYEHDGSYSIVIKDNHYFSDGPFYITQLSSDLEIEWQFRNPSTQFCVRQPDGTIACTENGPDGFPHPGGFEWCVNAPAVDARGNVYANSEDGFFYQIGQGGVLKTQTFLHAPLPSVYTPVSLDAGELTIFGR